MIMFQQLIFRGVLVFIKGAPLDFQDEKRSVANPSELTFDVVFCLQKTKPIGNFVKTNGKKKNRQNK